jgi:hypothetical protein
MAPASTINFLFNEGEASFLTGMPEFFANFQHITAPDSKIFGTF